MSNLSFNKLETSFRDGTTIIDNIFIHSFMPIIYNESYVKVYFDGLMRCFGEKNSHFTSINNIAEHLNMSKSSVQRAYQYFEEIYINFPESEYSDENGNIYLAKRVPRWLKTNPGQIKQISYDIFELEKINKKGSLTVEGVKQLKNLKKKRELIFADFQEEKDSTYKYQSSNAIVFLTNLRGLPNEIIEKFYNKILEVNKVWSKKFKSKKKKENEEKENDIFMSEGGSTDDILGGSTDDTQINTNILITPNISIKPNNQTIKKDSLFDCIDENYKIENSNFKTYKQLLDSCYLRENFELYYQYPYSNWIETVKTSIGQIYKDEYTYINKRKYSRYDLVEKLQNLELDIVCSAIQETIDYSTTNKILYPVQFMKTMIISAIDEFHAKIQTDINYIGENEFIETKETVENEMIDFNGKLIPENMKFYYEKAVECEKEGKTDTMLYKEIKKQIDQYESTLN